MKICDFYDLYWRVEFSDGDWEELTRRELRHGITLAAQVSSSAQEVNRPLPGHLLAPRASSWGVCGGSGADGSSSSFKTNLSFRYVQIPYRDLARGKDKTRLRSPSKVGSDLEGDTFVFSPSSDSIPGSGLKERHTQVQVSRVI